MLSLDTRLRSVLPLVGSIDPQTIDGGGDASVSSDWIDMSKADSILAVVNVGTVAAGATVTLSWLQATADNDDNDDAKPLDDGNDDTSDGTFDPITYTASGAYASEGPVSMLDVDGRFRWIQAVLTGAIDDIVAGLTLHQGGVRAELGLNPSTIPSP